jgi:lipoate-protein ligase A
MLIVESSSLDVYRNLAIEEYLMDEVRDAGPILFLWRSECAVVMGKNQNPWKECRLDLMERDGVALARRVSGGGTVYHDAGNLNYCVITDRESYKEEQAYQIIFKTLELFGMKAERTGKSNLSVEGLKFSGNAFAFRKGRAMHHGTLLLDTDLKRLARYLGSMLEGIETHAIASVPADVANLKLSQEELTGALKGQFLSLYADGSSEVTWTDQDLDPDIYAPALDRQRSDEWIYGATPSFSIEHDGVLYKIVKGRVVEGGETEKFFKNLANSWVC